MHTDPLQKIESMVRDIHDRAGKRTQPVMRRYPLLFAFLLVFSAAAILHGFDMWADKLQLFADHPLYLVGVGVLALIITGTLYHSLDKMS
jgi:uncharacterized membrane protein